MAGRAETGGTHETDHRAGDLIRSDRAETELTRAIHGGMAHKKRLNDECALLLEEGKVERRGAGLKSDPYRYWPIGAGDAAQEAVDRASAIGGAACSPG